MSAVKVVQIDSSPTSVAILTQDDLQWYAINQTKPNEQTTYALIHRRLSTSETQLTSIAIYSSTLAIQSTTRKGILLSLQERHQQAIVNISQHLPSDIRNLPAEVMLMNEQFVVISGVNWTDQDGFRLLVVYNWHSNGAPVVSRLSLRNGQRIPLSFALNSTILSVLNVQAATQNQSLCGSECTIAPNGSLTCQSDTDTLAVTYGDRAKWITPTRIFKSDLYMVQGSDRQWMSNALQGRKVARLPSAGYMLAVTGRFAVYWTAYMAVGFVNVHDMGSIAQPAGVYVTSDAMPIITLKWMQAHIHVTMAETMLIIGVLTNGTRSHLYTLNVSSHMCLYLSIAQEHIDAVSTAALCAAKPPQRPLTSSSLPSTSATAPLASSSMSRRSIPTATSHRDTSESASLDTMFASTLQTTAHTSSPTISTPADTTFVARSPPTDTITSHPSTVDGNARKTESISLTPTQVSMRTNGSAGSTAPRVLVKQTPMLTIALATALATGIVLVILYICMRRRKRVSQYTPFRLDVREQDDYALLLEAKHRFADPSGQDQLDASKQCDSTQIGVKSISQFDQEYSDMHRGTLPGLDAAVLGHLRGLDAVRLRQALEICGVGPFTGTTYLHFLACMPCGDVQDTTACLRALIAAGLDVNAPDQDGCTPLLLAAKIGNPVMIMALLAAQADIDVTDDQHRDVLILACMTGNHSVLAALSAVKSQLNAKRLDDMGRAALHWLVSVGDAASLVYYLNDLQLPVHIIDSVGNTCWHYVVKEGRTDLVTPLATLRRGEAKLLLMQANDDEVRPLAIARLNAEDEMSSALTSLIRMMRKQGESDENLATRLRRTHQARTYRRLPKVE